MSIVLSIEARLEVALSACNSIRFAVKNAARHGGDFSLNDILAADRLAKEALESAPAPTAVLKKRSVKKKRSPFTRIAIGAGMSLQDIATKSGLALGTVYNIACEKNRCPTSRARVENVLGVQIAWANPADSRYYKHYSKKGGAA